MLIITNKRVGLKYINVLFELKHRIFISHGVYFLNTTLKVPGVGFSIAGLDRAKFDFYRFQRLLLVVVIVRFISLKTAF